MTCKPENVSRAVFCAHYGGAVELQYEAATNSDTLLPAVYECPYYHEKNPLKVPGRVLWAIERDSTKDPTDPPIVS
jgi:hypothetical protein